MLEFTSQWFTRLFYKAFFRTVEPTDMPIPDWKSTPKSNLFALVKGIASWPEEDVKGNLEQLLDIWVRSFRGQTNSLPCCKNALC